MIEEQAQVLDWHNGRALVRVDRSSACGSCKARAACGQGLAQSLSRTTKGHELEVQCSTPLRAGDQVVLAIDENQLVQGAFLVYLLPLLALVVGAVLGQWLQAGEGLSIVLGFAGFAAAFGWLALRNRHYAKQACMQPKVVRVLPAVIPAEPVRWAP